MNIFVNQLLTLRHIQTSKFYRKYILVNILHSYSVISFQVPIIENNVCEEMFDQGGHKKKILPSFLCAGYANGQKDSCEVS